MHFQREENLVQHILKASYAIDSEALKVIQKFLFLFFNIFIGV